MTPKEAREGAKQRSESTTEDKTVEMDATPQDVAVSQRQSGEDARGRHMKAKEARCKQSKKEQSKGASPQQKTKLCRSGRYPQDLPVSQRQQSTLTRPYLASRVSGY